MASVQRAEGVRSVFGLGAASAAHRLRNAVYRLVGPLLLLAASVVAAASQANAPRQYLDEKTGVTVFFVGRPLVFARELESVAVRAWPDDRGSVTPGRPDARNYVTLAAAAVDRMGKYTYVLIGYFWLVGTPRPSESVCVAREHLVLQLGERRIELAAFDGSARDVGINQPIHRPTLGNADPAVYTIDLATLGLIAESAHPVLYCGAEKAPLKYELFEDRLPALRELVQQLRD